MYFNETTSLYHVYMTNIEFEAPKEYCSKVPSRHTYIGSECLRRKVVESDSEKRDRESLGKGQRHGDARKR